MLELRVNFRARRRTYPTYCRGKERCINDVNPIENNLVNSKRHAFCFNETSIYFIINTVELTRLFLIRSNTVNTSFFP